MPIVLTDERRATFIDEAVKECGGEQYREFIEGVVHDAENVMLGSLLAQALCALDPIDQTTKPPHSPKAGEGEW